MTDNSYVVLVAFQVTAPNMKEAQERLLPYLKPTLESYENPPGPVECWWVADDERYDGSDCDSAVFVTPGYQHAASRLLEREGMTPAWNITPDRPSPFEGPERLHD